MLLDVCFFLFGWDGNINVCPNINWLKEKKIGKKKSWNHFDVNKFRVRFSLIKRSISCMQRDSRYKNETFYDIYLLRIDCISFEIFHLFHSHSPDSFKTFLSLSCAAHSHDFIVIKTQFQVTCSMALVSQIRFDFQNVCPFLGGFFFSSLFLTCPYCMQDKANRKVKFRLVLRFRDQNRRRMRKERPTEKKFHLLLIDDFIHQSDGLSVGWFSQPWR